jgi:signal transduction histidine kinase
MTAGLRSLHHPLMSLEWGGAFLSPASWSWKMRLSAFITEHMEAILQEWEDFARTVSIPGKPMDAKGLRNHASLMLAAMAKDLETEQTAQQQLEKSQGHAPENTAETAAESHALTRLTAGFTIDQMVSEYRALRASVLKLWMRTLTTDSVCEMQDMLRFNEAIDQAMTESIASYTRAAQASRDIFLGILGHDLRTPLGAILLASDVLLRTDDLGQRATKLSARIYSSVKRANRIVGDLLDFTRSHLGHGIPVQVEEIDLVPVCEQIVDEASTFHLDADITLATCDSAAGRFDAARVEQVFSNLISNAVHHGDRKSPIAVSIESTEEEVIFSVLNQGQPIPADVLPTIFNPLQRYTLIGEAGQSPNGGLGLGLHIASEIVDAHQGQIQVKSDSAGTRFTVRLPKFALIRPEKT